MGPRLSLAAFAALLTALLGVPAAQAAIPASLKTSCTLQTPAAGHSYQFCDDGLPPSSGTTPNVGGVNAVTVPAKYDGWEGLPARAADATTVPGSDPDGDVALDVDISIPTTPAPEGGYPLLFFMHGCCAGTKRDFEDASFDPANEHWHFNNAWFASRGYVVVNYTARGFHGVGESRGSTGQTQLDSRLYEINDYQSLAGQIADDPFFNVNPERVVTTGGSYGGGFSWLSLTDPKWSSPDGKDMSLAASAPRYGWTDIIYSLVPNGRQSHDAGNLPAFDGTSSTQPFGIPKRSINFGLFFSGLFGTTFPQSIITSFNCLNGPDPFETSPLCAPLLETYLPEFVYDRSAYYQNEWFDRIASDPSYRTPIFNAGTLTDPLFTSIETIRMVNRIRSLVPDYPVKEYYGDYEHFVQNKAKEWADVCGPDRHVCTTGDYAGGLNVDPADLRRMGVHTRLNRFIDHYAKPASNPAQSAPTFDVTAAAQICPQNASAEFPADEPGQTFVASSFAELAPYRFRFEATGDQQTKNDSTANPHADGTNPLINVGGAPICFAHTTGAGPDVAVYDSEPLVSPQTMVGATELSVDYTATSAEGLQLNSRLYDVFPDGKQVLVDRGPYRATSAAGTATYELHGNAWRFEPGHRIRIEVAQDDDPYLKSSVVPSTATIHGVQLSVPVRQRPLNPGRYCRLAEALDKDAFKNKYRNFGRCVSQRARSKK